MIEKIVSGGQTGVDRAALDAAVEFSVEHGGWCPHGRLAEDGIISNRYQLKETPSAEYDQRTEWNVRDSDGVLLVVRGTVTGGTLYTRKTADRMGRPHMIVNPTHWNEVANVILWMTNKSIKVLDIAGPRESQDPGIYADSVKFISLLLKELASQ